MIKDYFRITDMTAEFQSWHAQRKDFNFDDNAKNLAFEARLWELKFLLAISQQVSIVASHLGKIVQKAKETTE